MTVTPGRVGLTYRFSALTSRVTGTSISSYQWKLSGRQIATGAQISHTFAKPGTYMVSVTITTKNGASATHTVSVRARTRTATAHVTVHFATDRSALPTAAERALTPLRELFADATRGQITGYSATREAHPGTLATQRARAVAVYLEANHNRRPRKLTITGAGTAHPAASNWTATGRTANRRAVITITYPKPD